MSRLDEIAARAEAATEGPWAVFADGFDWPYKGIDADIGISVVIGGSDGGVQTVADAAFIATARTDVPDLVGLVRTLGEALRGLDLYNSGAFGPAERAALALYDEWTTG